MKVLKKSNFDILIPPPKSTQGSGTGLGSKITFDMFHIYYTSVCSCYNVAAFTIPFDVQHYHVLKKFNFDLLMREGGGGAAGKLFATMLLHLPFHFVCPFSEKVEF